MPNIQSLMNTLGIKNEDIEKIAGVKKLAAAAPINTVAVNPVDEFLTKVANEMGDMNPEEAKAAIKQAVEAINAQGGPQNAEESQFMQEASEFLRESGEMMSFASVKLANGPSDLDANIAEQTGLMADVAKSIEGKLKETSPTAQDKKGDERGGEDDPMAIGQRQPEDNGPAKYASGSPMSKLAQQVAYNNYVDQLADYCIEKMASDLRTIESQQQRQPAYQEKVAEMNKLAAASELEGRLIARAFVDELNKIAMASRR